MAFAFDTLGYAKRLRSEGIPNEQAEAHAEAAREFIMAELVTKTDLLAVKSDVLGVKSDLLATKSELITMIDTLTLRLTVRLGSIVAVGIGVLVALIGILTFSLRLH